MSLGVDGDPGNRDWLQHGPIDTLAELLRSRAQIDERIAGVTGRPAERGHTGEFIAADIFGIELYRNAAIKGSDGFFQHEPLKGATVNVKWYGKSQGMLNIGPDPQPDYYLVMTGPKGDATSSRGRTNPWVIDSVFLFSGPRLVEALRKSGRKTGVAAGVPQALWRNAQVYPDGAISEIVLSVSQRRLLALFKSHSQEL